MTTIRFAIDEGCWRFEGIAPEVCIESLETLLDLLDRAAEQGHGVCYSDELFNRKVWGESTFYDLYAEASPIPIPHELRERVAALFLRLPKWQELDSWPTDLDIQLNDDETHFAPTIAWAHGQARQNRSQSVACLTLAPGGLTGSHRVVVNGMPETLWFVSTEEHYLQFFRWLVVETTSNSHELAALASSAFPSLQFVDGVFAGMKGMSKPYRNLIEPVAAHLTALSDHGTRIFSGPWDRVANEFGSLGVRISDENGNTKANAEARRQRTVNINGIERIFWWHTKLEPDRDRIHICPDEVTGGGALIVGIMCDHLLT